MLHPFRSLILLLCLACALPAWASSALPLLKLDMADLAADDRDDYARRLSDSLRDPIFADIDLPPL